MIKKSYTLQKSLEHDTLSTNDFLGVSDMDIPKHRIESICELYSSLYCNYVYVNISDFINSETKKQLT